MDEFVFIMIHCLLLVSIRQQSGFFFINLKGANHHESRHVDIWRSSLFTKNDILMRIVEHDDINRT